MFCKMCGAKIKDDALFCPKCGNRLTDYVENSKIKNNYSVEESHGEDPHFIEEPEKVHAKKTSSFPVWIIVFLVVVFIGVFAVIIGVKIIYDKNHNGKTTMIQEEVLEDENDTIISSDIADTTNNTTTSVATTGDTVIKGDEVENTEKSVDENENVTDSVESIDVEAEVKAVREKYDSIVNMIQKGDCREVIIDNDITGYFSDDIKAILVNKGYDGNEYSRKYYFDDGNLIFAYFEADDAYRLYFKDDQLFRWRYSKKASDPQNAVNHDEDYVDEYDHLEEYAIDEAYSMASWIRGY